MLLELHEIAERLRNTDMKKVAQATGISYMTLHGIVKNPNANPTYKTIVLLSEVLR